MKIKARIDRIANYAFIDWKDNMDILDDAPSVYYPNDAQPSLSGVIHGICRSTCASRQVADAGSAVIHQMSVPPVHTVRCILPGHIHNLIPCPFQGASGCANLAFENILARLRCGADIK